MKKIIYFLVVVIVFSAVGCNVSKSYLQNGQYDLAVKTAVRKLNRNKNKKRQLRVLAEAYPKALETENNRIKYLHEEGSPDRWDEIFHIYSNMKDRQTMVERLYPLYLDGQEIRFEHIDYDQKIIEAKNKAADYYYHHAKMLMEKNDKFAYRQAYDELHKVIQYSDAYSDAPDLFDECYQKGQTHIILIAVNSTPVQLPPDFMVNLINFPVQDFNSFWIKYYTTDVRKGNYDIYVNITLTNVVVGPNDRSVREYTEKKKIKDGWEYKLDANGNKVLDSLGNPIKITKYKTISCTVYETRQFKKAHIDGAVNYVDGQTRQIIISAPIAADHVFEHYYSTAKGNLDALSNETKAKLKARPVSYPSDADMIYNANATVKDVIYNVIMDKKAFIINNY